MSNAMEVVLKLRLADFAGEGLKKLSRELGQNQKQIEALAQADSAAHQQMSQSAKRLAAARTLLGVRAETEVQGEIKKTMRAYAELSRSGEMSAAEQGRAFEAMRRKVVALRQEIGEVSKAQRAFGAIKIAAPAVAGAAVALAPAAKAAMSYDQRLAHMANTAFAGKSLPERQGGMRYLESNITAARRVGGGTRESVAEALDTMLASGAFGEDPAAAVKMLPAIAKAATAGGANASEIATIAVRAFQSYGIKPEQMGKALDMALRAGQAGGFELKDMAKWLPQQMAMSRNLGGKGMADFAKILAWNQASVITSGTKDEAGNNLRDLFNELNTPHFKNYMATELLAGGQKAKPGEKQQRLKTIDQRYLDYQAQGVGKLDATVEMVDQLFARNPAYKKLQGQLAQTQDAPERARILEAMRSQVEGSQLGKLFHNQQSLMAMLGIINNRQYVGKVLGEVQNSGGAVADSHALISGTAGYKLEQAGQEVAVAQKATLDNLTPAIGSAAEGLGRLAQTFPTLTTAAFAATGALGALAATALAQRVLGGGAGAAGGLLGAGAGALGALKPALKVGGVGAIAAMGVNALAPAVAGQGSALASYAGNMANYGALGATLGSAVAPGVGTVVGAGLGAGVGALMSYLERSKAEAPKPAEAQQGKLRLEVALDPALKLAGQTSQLAMPSALELATGNLMSGAPR